MISVEFLRQKVVENLRRCDTWINRVTYEREATSFVQILIDKYYSGLLSRSLPDILISELETGAFRPGEIRSRYDYYSVKMAWDNRPRRGDMHDIDEEPPFDIRYLESKIPLVPLDITGRDIDRILDATRKARMRIKEDGHVVARQHKS